MEIIYSLFDEFSQAENAFRELVSSGFDRNEINVILAQSTAKNFMDIDQNRIKAEKSPALPDTGTGSGLDRYLGGEQGVNVPDVGSVLAAGELANFLIDTAISPGGNDRGLKKALESFSVQADEAEAYRDGVEGGGVLMFIRTTDDRAGQAAGILKERKGKHVAGYR